MATASPYYQTLRRNEPRQRQFTQFTKKLGSEPRHLVEDIVHDTNWAGASLLFEALNNGAPDGTVLDLIQRYPEACKTKDANGTRPIAVAMRQVDDKTCPILFCLPMSTTGLGLFLS